MTKKRVFLFSLAGLCLAGNSAYSQSLGMAGTVAGTVTDPSKAVVAGADIEIRNPISGFARTAKSGSDGTFKFNSVPPNNYHLLVSAAGFQPAQQDVNVRTTVPINVNVSLNVAAATGTSINVSGESADLVENVPSSHTDIDSSTFDKLPTSSPGGGMSDAITLATPGVVADSNGFFHPIGDHAQTGFSVDNQPITDQQSKLFSTSIPLNAIASMEVIAGAPTAEFGDKTSLIVNAITRSGMGVSKPFGGLTLKYGSFGTVGEDFSYGFGTPKFGEFVAANIVRSGRYLDTPEFSPLHDRGNNETIFDPDRLPTDGSG